MIKNIIEFVAYSKPKSRQLFLQCEIEEWYHLLRIKNDPNEMLITQMEVQVRDMIVWPN